MIPRLALFSAVPLPHLSEIQAGRVTASKTCMHARASGMKEHLWFAQVFDPSRISWEQVLRSHARPPVIASAPSSRLSKIQVCVGPTRSS
eukprot:3382695-Pleurochrysis_carterae.AAC.4